MSINIVTSSLAKIDDKCMLWLCQLLMCMHGGVWYKASNDRFRIQMSFVIQTFVPTLMSNIIIIHLYLKHNT